MQKQYLWHDDKILTADHIEYLDSRLRGILEPMNNGKPIILKTPKSVVVHRKTLEHGILCTENNSESLFDIIDDNQRFTTPFELPINLQSRLSQTDVSRNLYLHRSSEKVVPENDEMPYLKFHFWLSDSKEEENELNLMIGRLLSDVMGKWHFSFEVEVGDELLSPPCYSTSCLALSSAFNELKSDIKIYHQSRNELLPLYVDLFDGIVPCRQIMRKWLHIVGNELSTSELNQCLVFLEENQLPIKLMQQKLMSIYKPEQIRLEAAYNQLRGTLFLQTSSLDPMSPEYNVDIEKLPTSLSIRFSVNEMIPWYEIPSQPLSQLRVSSTSLKHGCYIQIPRALIDQDSINVTLTQARI